ncbi:MAG TPA: Ivy family c-type lysozyme inhibitor [Burkholderiaceae bacterium]|nr:Ivy family c-type lysozyme inhibitor [Burkholderiaceae bacterium]
MKSHHQPASGRSAALAAALLVAASAAAQTGLDAPTLRQFGGRYAVDCASAAAPRLRVDADALLVEQGNQRMTGRNAMSSYSYFGNSPPPKDFQVALMGEVRGGLQLLFMVYADKGGPYIRLEGDAKVAAALGKALMTSRFRRCEAPSAPVAAPPPTPAAAPRAAAPGAAPELGTLVEDAAFKRAYLKAIGPLAAQRWLARFEGPAPSTRMQTFDGTPYVVIGICKAHDCYDHNASFLYSAAQQRVIGLVQQNGVKTLVGAPGAALAPQLERLWQSQWRQK